MPTYVYPILAVAVLLLIFFISGYLKAPPDTAYIISGMRKRRILIGKAGFRIPFFERVDKLSLKVMQVDVKTSEAVPTNEFINVTVDGVANIKVSSDPELLNRSAEALLGMSEQDLIRLVTQVLEGNMREIVGSVGLKEMVQDRQGVAKKITENVVPDMEKLGIEVVNFNIQNFKDAAGTIENMGIDNVEQIPQKCPDCQGKCPKGYFHCHGQRSGRGQRHQGSSREKDRRAECRSGHSAGGYEGKGRFQKGRSRCGVQHSAGKSAEDHRNHPVGCRYCKKGQGSRAG